MDGEETVIPQVEEKIEAPIIDQKEAVQEVEEKVETVEQFEERESRTQVPLSALQKERKKRQELELELQWEKQRRQEVVKPAEEDTSKYESATREDLNRSRNETVRIVEEKLWIKNNPEKYEKINEYLPEFLKQRPNLASAINSAENRYEEAYTLMEALTPRQQENLRKSVATPKKEAPNSPSNVPKAQAMNNAVDVMSMSDQEFSAWRREQKRR